MIGQTISHYRILEKLGEGGMGVVYKAEDTKLKRFVALKFLPPQLVANQTDKSRLLHEARAAAALHHPSICTVHEIGEADGQTFIAMAYVEGQSLKERLETGPLDLATALDIVVQVGEGLQRAHTQSIVHRDLKPANIMLTRDGQAVLMDFGLAKMGEATRLTKTGTIMGTVAYMSPEQARGAGVDRRTDVWSLGVVLYEMLTGQLPFRGGHEQAIIYSVLNERPESLTSVNRHVPYVLEEIVNKALTQDSGKRYQQVDELLADLRQQRDKLELGLKTERFVRLRRLKRRRRLVYSAVTALVLVVVGVTLSIQHRRGQVIDSIAVLPVTNLSGDPEQEYFADGMTDALINELAHLGAFRRVISRTSVMQYKNSNKSLLEIARELRVDAVVEASVLRQGDRVRVTAQLIDTANDRNLWADRYEHNLRDILTLFGEVTRAIAREINITVTAQEEARLARTRTVDPEAYEDYLKGRAFAQKWTLKDFERSFEHLERAIRKDPTFAPAYAALASAYGDAGVLYLDGEAYPKAKEAVTRALELDDTLAEAHTALANVRYIFEWDWEGAEQAFQRALTLNPNSAAAHHDYARFLVFIGLFETSFAEYKVVLELDPLSIWYNQSMGWGYYHARRYDESIAQFKKTLALIEDFPDPVKEWQVHTQLAWNYIKKGLYDEALAEIDAWNPDSFARAWAYVEAGRRDEAAELINKLLGEPEVLPYVAAVLGEKDLAFRRLEAMYEERNTYMLFLKVGVELDNLRSDPRYADLLRRMDFPD